MAHLFMLQTPFLILAGADHTTVYFCAGVTAVKQNDTEELTPTYTGPHEGHFTLQLLLLRRHQKVDDRYSIHPSSWPPLPSWTRAEVRSSSRVGGGFVCIPGPFLCCLSGQTGVCASWRHITSASSLEGGQVTRCGGRAHLCTRGAGGGRNDQAHSSVKNSLHPKSPRQEEEEAGCWHPTPEPEWVVGAVCKWHLRDCVASSLQVDTEMVTRVSFQ